MEHSKSIPMSSVMCRLLILRSGYLIAQFLAPSTNHRTDQYGGSLENRSRIIFEINEEIRKRVPASFVVGIKLNSVEFQSGGFNTEECKQLCTRLEAAKFDFVELSGGTYEELVRYAADRLWFWVIIMLTVPIQAFVHKKESTKKREAFFLEFAETIVPTLKKTKIFVTGGFKTVGAMVRALDIVDGAGLARAVCQEFRFCSDVLSGKIKGAIKQRLDESDFGLTSVASGTFMRMVGRDQEPIDLSQEKYEKVYMQSMGHWADLMKKDTEGYFFGYIDVEGIQPNPYGVVY